MQLMSIRKMKINQFASVKCHKSVAATSSTTSNNRKQTSHSYPVFSDYLAGWCETGSSKGSIRASKHLVRR